MVNPEDRIKSQLIKEATLNTLKDKLNSSSISEAERIMIKEGIEDLSERRNSPPVISNTCEKLDRKSFKRS